MARFRVFGAFLIAVVTMALLGSIASTQFVLAGLSAVGADIGLADRIGMTAFDIAGFGPAYGAIVALGFVIAFPAATLANRLLPLPRALVFAVAGAACLGLTLFLMEQVFFGMPVIAGARSVAGVAVQIVAGALCGWLFAAMTRRRSGRRP